MIKGLENVDAKVIYNLVDDDLGIDKKRILKLVSNTRITPEKGLDRMLVFALHYAEVANIKKLLPEDNIECDICLIASNHNIPNQKKAKRYLQWIHSDYRKYPIKLKNKGKVEYIAVSKHCAKVIKELENVDAKVIYNLVDDDFGADKRRVLKLVSNTRISYEKGMDRMLVFAKKLKEKGVRFVWLVCGDNSWNPKYFEETKNKFRDIEEVYFVGYKKDITIGLGMADYLVHLCKSD